VKTNEEHATAAGHSVDVAGWIEEFDAGFACIAGRFGRVEPRRQARAFLLGLLSDVDSRTCWALAEQAGDVSPQRMQRLLGEAVWDAGKVRDDLRTYVVATLGDPQGVLVLDDTGDLKKGARTVGVQRQYTGTAGRIENAQVAVFLAYATAAGRALIDRELYLPRNWTDNPARCAAAGVPADVEFATKTVLGRRMITRALDAGVPAAWVTADEAYGGDQALRKDLQTRGIGYVLAVAKSHHVVLATAGDVRADTVVADLLPSRAWQRLSAGAGAKGERDYDWAWIAIVAPVREEPGQHALLVRRRISDGELAYYRCFSAQPVTLAALVRVAGIRWMVEECFQAGKGETGLDQHQVRRWTSWHRYTTLVMLAHAILTAIAVAAHTVHDLAGDLIPLTVNEIRHLFAKLVLTPTRTATYWLTWSDWRRRHQARAKLSHYRRRQTIDNLA
jgi:SRSO17 transposase